MLIASYAKEFAGLGDNLILVARNEDKLQSLARELRSQHSVEVVVYPCDLAKVGSAYDLQRAVVRDEGRFLA